MNLNIKIAVITSRFNEEITQLLKQGCLAQLQTLGLTDEQLKIIDVPGAVEIPFVAKQLALRHKYDAIICLGAVIRGETTHYDYVCAQVSNGCAKVMMKFDIPVIFGVLTTENEAQALDRVGGVHGHKGIDAANVALEMIHITRDIAAIF